MILRVKTAFFIAIILVSCQAIAQSNSFPLYEILPDAEETKILKGFITPKIIKEDSSFTWYAQTAKYFRPNAEAVKVIAEKAYDFHIIIFMGTWCHDSQQIMPKYLATLEAAEFPDHRMVMIAVDRQKNAHANLQRPLNVVNVPTLLIMKDGKEMGRIVEFGNGERLDTQLAEIVGKL